MLGKPAEAVWAPATNAGLVFFSKDLWTTDILPTLHGMESCQDSTAHRTDTTLPLEASFLQFPFHPSFRTSKSIQGDVMEFWFYAEIHLQ